MHIYIYLFIHVTCGLWHDCWFKYVYFYISKNEMEYKKIVFPICFVDDVVIVLYVRISFLSYNDPWEMFARTHYLTEVKYAFDKTNICLPWLFPKYKCNVKSNSWSNNKFAIGLDKLWVNEVLQCLRNILCFRGMCFLQTSTNANRKISIRQCVNHMSMA